MPMHPENYERFKAKMQAAKAKPENMNENGIITISGSEIFDPSFWAHVDISREGFAKNFDISARLAQDFTRKFVTNILPDAMTYIVSLNCSYDKNLREGEKPSPKIWKIRSGTSIIRKISLTFSGATVWSLNGSTYMCSKRMKISLI